jgi:hypothetical protein
MIHRREESPHGARARCRARSPAASTASLPWRSAGFPTGSCGRRNQKVKPAAAPRRAVMRRRTPGRPPSARRSGR